MRHLHPRDVTQICRVSLGHYCMYAAEQTFRGRGRNRRNKWKLERRGGRSNGRTGTCYCTMKNSSTCFNRRVFVLARVHPGAGVVHRAQRHQPTRPTDRELKIRVAVCTHRRRGYAVALSLSTSVCPCVHHSVQQPCLLVGEERYRPLKAIYFSDHLPKAKGAGSFDPALDSSR